MRDIASLKSTLNNSPIKNSDNALYQVIGSIIDSIMALSEPNDIEITNGLWQPHDASGAGLTFTYTIANIWTRLGPFVIVTGGLVYPVTANGSAAIIGGLPFPTDNSQFGAIPVYTTLAVYPLLVATGSNVLPFVLATGAQYTNAGLSAKDLRFTAVYTTP